MVTVRFTTYDRMNNIQTNIPNPIYKRVSIWQLPVNSKYCFRNYREAKKYGFNIYDYVMVWADCLKIGLYDKDVHITDNNLNKFICERIFSRFNNSDIEHRCDNFDYSARSLSISDVICITDVEKDIRNFYYVDGYGVVALDGDLFSQSLN